ncbi:protoporphyrinogen oxidase [Colletotrichum orchidophilum]|uniref:Protoporphyrinogen oxidase n=1 Tax=Colletotrichum orchidophilum TaxID=1209926 RepID=A0A1G4BDT1_9PEZI|nr:protoporphyrinogen oxidase [Colletotrichum orchidophilum]OHE99551.1 protoporphyrinogen oxidase [Colletotrichum orchidophilum]
MALLRSYHSQRFCSAALGACGRSALVPARSFSTSTAVGKQQRAPPRQSSKEAEPIFTKNVQVPTDVAVIGGGIAGLTTAHYLAKLLPETSNITVYEAGNRLGGWIDTQEVEVEVNGKKNNVRFERGPRTLRGMGKDTWKFDDLVLFDLIRDLEMQGEYLGIKSPPRYIYYPDHLVEIHPRNVFREAAFKGIIPGFLNVMWRRSQARQEHRPSDMSVSDFIARYVGRPELTDNLASAMIHGIWGGDADKLSMRSFMPGPWHRFFNMPASKEDWILFPRSEVGLLHTLGVDPELRGYLKSAQKDQLVFFEKGMSSLPNTIAERLRKRKNVTIKMGEPVTGLEYDCKGSKVLLSSPKSASPTSYDKVVSTTTSKALHAVTNDALPSLASSPNVSIMAVNLWYPQPNLNASHPGVGYLVPRATDSNLEGLLGVFFDSDVVPCAPDEPEGTKFFVLMGGHYWNDLPAGSYPTEQEGIEMAKSVLERHLGIPKTQPAFAMAHLAKDCIPQHHVGHWEQMGRASYELQDAFGGQLAVAGGSYTNIGVTGAIRAGYDMAVHIAQSAQAHVGDTGLAQFEWSKLELFETSRTGLRHIGRDIEETIGWRNYVR